MGVFVLLDCVCVMDVRVLSVLLVSSRCLVVIGWKRGKYVILLLFFGKVKVNG